MFPLIRNDRSIPENFDDRRMELEELIQLGCEIALLKDRESLLLTLHEKIKKLIPFDDIIITLYNHHQGTHAAFLYHSEEARLKHPDFDNARNTHSPIEDGVVDLTIASDEPVIFNIDELSKKASAPVYIRFYKKSGIKEFVGVSMRNSNGIFGGLYMFSEHEGTYFSRQFKLINAVANQLASAVTNILAHEVVLNKEKEKTILLNISNHLAIANDLQDLPEVLLRTLNTLFVFDHAVIFRFYSERFHVSGHSYRSDSLCKICPDYENDMMPDYEMDMLLLDELKNARFPRVFDVQKLVLKDNCPEFIHNELNGGMKELVMVPICSGSELSGILMLVSETTYSFSLSQLELLQGISNQVSAVMANAVARNELLALDSDKSKLITLSNSLAAARYRPDLHMIVNDELQKLFPFDHAVILKISQDGKWLSAFLLDPKSKSKQHPDYDVITTGRCSVNPELFEDVFETSGPQIFDLHELVKSQDSPQFFQLNYACGMRETMIAGLNSGQHTIGMLILFADHRGYFRQKHIALIEGLTSQLASAMSNIIANERIEKQVLEITSFKKQLEAENQYLQEEIQINHNYSEIIGTSHVLRKVFKLVSDVASTGSSVLILGETGTGKELIARAIHNASPRRDKLMVKVNCATLPAALIESELFGHERGSFTGATEKRIGKFELANNSTLFLDEIGEMPLELQVKLLRALQEREIERIGARNVIKTDVRIIAATNRDLEKEVQSGNFRSDLYYRLNVFPITLPPLRERKEDLPMLAMHFLAKHSKQAGKHVVALSPNVIRELSDYDWPGNIRELEHLIERTVLLSAHHSVISEIDLPQSSPSEPETHFFDNSDIKTIDELEKEHISRVLKFCGGKVGGVGGAAEILKLPPTTLNSKIKKFGIQKISPEN